MKIQMPPVAMEKWSINNDNQLETQKISHLLLREMKIQMPPVAMENIKYDDVENNDEAQATVDDIMIEKRIKMLHEVESKQEKARFRKQMI